MNAELARRIAFTLGALLVYRIGTHIPLPGNIERTEKALHLVFDGHCKADQPKSPF